jgi:hypothetical protein
MSEPIEVPGTPPADPRRAEAALEWSFNPWRERPGRAALAATVALGLCAAVMSLGEATVLTIGLSLAAITSFSPLLSPARCRVDGTGAACGGPFGWERRAWGDIRRAVTRPAALVLSPYASPHWLEAYRALVLPLPTRDRQRLLGELRPVLERHGL